MQIKNISLDELPSGVRKVADRAIAEWKVRNVFRVTELDFGDGRVYYEISAISDSFILELSISELGVEHVNRIGVDTVRDAIKAHPERFGLE
ncbi:hypothetical protein [Geobacillus stearothermophilus]|uniref:hypothetical protein n=1 Tax=Geobacillus stearothermophilus TaxID=1422 RepID=UPI002E1E3A72|nr:hypothetical protein [Geobacillus stearothermophilus]MED3740145.1 hypothetical protein [Geobacillus stearothermophilus]MED3766000.1 hypothetical protein [Geobacillus stearothermophilus]MED3773699.1 hypothetical protein [Geobacillus stearothermophilus]